MRNPASLRSFIWAEVGAHGLYLPDRTLDTCLLALAGRGRWLWEHVFSPTLGARLPGLYGPATATEQRHEAGRIGGFSSIYCEHLQRALGARPDARASSGAAWLALAVTSLDRAIDVDGGGDALAELRRLSRSGALARALREPVSLDGPHLPPSLVPGLAALDACFANVRSLAAEAGAHGAAPACRGSACQRKPSAVSPVRSERDRRSTISCPAIRGTDRPARCARRASRRPTDAGRPAVGSSR